MKTKFILCWILLSASAFAQKSLWEGQFNVGPMWGGMDLRIAGNTAEARFTPSGHTEAPKLENLHVTSKAISFTAKIEDESLSFRGHLHRDSWLGTISGPHGHGTWRLSKLETANLPSRNTLPAPTGSYGIARQIFDWSDSSRSEMNIKPAGARRELLVYLYYPAVCHSTDRHVPYMPDASAMTKDWPSQIVQKAEHLTTHACANASVIPDHHFPLLLFMPGSGQKVLSYSSLLEDAASHGYIVAAIDPPYNAAAIQFPDGRVFRRLPPDQRSWEIAKSHADAPRLFKQLVTYWCQDESFVLDQLQKLQKQHNPIASAIDFDKVGAFGHSRGGSTAGRIRLLDPRIRAGINIDGNIRGVPFPPDEDSVGGNQPFLWLEKQLPWPTASQLKQMGLTHQEVTTMFAQGDHLLSTIPSDAYHVTIVQPDIDHLDFSDQALLNSQLTDDVFAQKMRTLEIARTYVVSFFDAYLKRHPSTFKKTLEKKSRQFPETKILFPSQI